MDWLRPEHPIRDFFAEALHTSLDRHVGCDEQIETYLIDLLVDFLHHDRLYAIRDRAGRRVVSVSEMLQEGEVTDRADSFCREREVHKHIGDYLLFCGGMFPEMLSDQGVDIDRQGRESYFIASTFSHSPFTQESRLLAKLSESFPDYRFGLKVVRDSLGRAA